MREPAGKENQKNHANLDIFNTSNYAYFDGFNTLNYADFDILCRKAFGIPQIVVSLQRYK